MRYSICSTLFDFSKMLHMTMMKIFYYFYLSYIFLYILSNYFIYLFHLSISIYIFQL